MLKKPVFRVTIATVLLIGMFVLLIKLGSGGNSADNENMHISGDEYDHHIYTIGTVLDLIQEEVKVGDSVKYKTIGYRVMVLVPLSEKLKEYDLINVYAKYTRKNPEEGPQELSAGDLIVVSYFKNALDISEYPYTINADEYNITYATYDLLEKYKRLWNGNADGLMDAMINVPDDFSISLAWDYNGRSRYDSASGELIKDIQPQEHPTSDFTTQFFLNDMGKAVLYFMLQKMNLDSYPDVYDPYTSTSLPSENIVLTVKSNDYEKTIRCDGIGFTSYDYSIFRPDPVVDENAGRFVTFVKTIVRMIYSSKEWKALPDFDFRPD
ncbi:MAG: hypothetical protein K6E47_14765 [Lachnospiraceae bacterium]|nr:hypothetical protein [Lachnospiraceae bacterium]